jgi:NLI interacting factor-like phosphatase
MPPIHTIALDLEGTLISNAVSQFPRSGLFEFLDACRSLVPRLVIFTSPNPAIVRDALQRLAADELAPAWIADLEIFRAPTLPKDLRRIDDDWQGCLLVDDMEPTVHADQHLQWIPVTSFDPTSEEDSELETAAECLVARCRAQ